MVFIDELGSYESPRYIYWIPQNLKLYSEGRRFASARLQPVRGASRSPSFPTSWQRWFWLGTIYAFCQRSNVSFCLAMAALGNIAAAIAESAEIWSHRGKQARPRLGSHTNPISLSLKWPRWPHGESRRAGWREGARGAPRDRHHLTP